MILPSVAFLEAVQDVSAGNVKIPQSEFLDHGALAVVDQGQSLVAGYTDDSTATVKTVGPLIVFGDHTRALKYIDFPFAMGADGVKVLRVRDGFHPKYVYHYLRFREIPSVGYSRHFKFLREIPIPRPRIDEQRRIAAILDQADALHAKRRQVLAHFDILKRAIFDEMFGDLPWNGRLDDLVEVQIGPFGSLLHQEDYVTGGVQLLNPMHIRNGLLEPDSESSVSELKASTLLLYRLREDDIVLGRRGEMGRAGIVLAQHRGMLCGTGSLILRPRGGDSHFLHALITSSRMKEHLEREALGATLPNLNSKIVKSAPAPIVPADAQDRFALKIRAVDRLTREAERLLRSVEYLFAALQSRAFRGEL